MLGRRLDKGKGDTDASAWIELELIPDKTTV